jgi:hypothetical protein
VGTAIVAGVDIKVLGLKEKNAGVSHSMHVAQGVDNTTESDYWEVDLGEVKIILEREMDGPISLTIFDGQQFGIVVKDDELLIDVDRKVTINGEERTPK